jgi:hypothetical protein
MPPNTRWSRPAYRAVFDLGSRFSIFPPDNLVLAPAAQLNRWAAPLYQVVNVCTYPQGSLR